ncbi:MAG: glycosyltransferase [Bacteroidales bacterium]
MKRILVFIDWYIPGYRAGGPIRSLSNMVENLGSEYEFYIFTRNTDYLDATPYPSIKPDQWIKTGPYENVYYCSNENLSVFTIFKTIKSVKFDLAYINGVYSFYFSMVPLLVVKFFTSVKYIIAPRGMLSKQTFKAKNLKKRTGIFIARITRLYKNAIFHVTSADEYNDLILLNLKPLKIFQANNFPSIINEKRIQKIDKKKGELKLLYIGRISNEKNTLFALECLGNFIYNGQIDFEVYGSVYQQDYWEKCKEIIDKLPVNIKVSYHGSLEYSKVAETIGRSHFLFMPSLGENFGHSLLESLANGRPVITSNTTPWKNLAENKAGWDIPLNKPELFAEAIQTAINMDNIQFRDYSKSAFDYAISKLDIENLKQDYQSLFG